MSEINRRDFIKTIGQGALAASLYPSIFLSQSSTPNFVIILTDDQGYGDVGCYGARDFGTPNLDKMAKEGMRFTSYCVPRSVCSASRASLLTGCYPRRVGITGALSPTAKIGINPKEETLAELLGRKGYVSGIFGKWHLGHRYEFLPLQNGFNDYFGLPYSNDDWPISCDGSAFPSNDSRSKFPFIPLLQGNSKIGEIRSMSDQSQLTTLYTEQAIRFIEKNRKRPFFLYLAHSMPHIPLAVSGKFQGASKKGIYGDVIMEIDWSVGMILSTLKKYNLDTNTLVVFTSDNGASEEYGEHGGSNGPLREGKTTTWEGGVRVPCIMRWPGSIPAGAVCSRLAASMDLLPTFVSLAKAPRPKNKIDGVDIRPLLTGNNNAKPRRTLYYYSDKNLECVRKDDWKLVLPHTYESTEGILPGSYGCPGQTYQAQTGYELYDLKKDVGERKNVIAKYPDMANTLWQLAEQARNELGDGSRVGKGQRSAGKVG